MNAEFTNALRAAMDLQRQMLEVSSLGTSSSQLNAEITLKQMWKNHDAIGAFLKSVEARL